MHRSYLLRVCRSANVTEGPTARPYTARSASEELLDIILRTLSSARRFSVSSLNMPMILSCDLPRRDGDAIAGTRCDVDHVSVCWVLQSRQWLQEMDVSTVMRTVLQERRTWSMANSHSHAT